MPKSTKPPAFAGFDAVRPAAPQTPAIGGLPAGLSTPAKHPAPGKAPAPKRMAVKPPPLPRRTGG